MIVMASPDRHNVLICRILRFSSIIATSRMTSGSCCIMEMAAKGVRPKNDSIAK